MSKVAIQSTRDYKMFKKMTANRVVSDNHVMALKKSYEDYGNLTAVQPILVNERMEVVDGQHRLEAAKEAGEPIYYTVAPGLRVEEVRALNTSQRGWTVDDYAFSFAAAGNENYIRYLRLREEFGFGHASTIVFANLGAHQGDYVRFRNGELDLSEEKYRAARILLAQYEELVEYSELFKVRTAAIALCKIMGHPQYSHSRMVDKTKLYGAAMIKRYGTADDTMRMLEDLYNHHQAESTRVRFF